MSENDSGVVKAAKITGLLAVVAAVLGGLVQVLGPIIGLPPIFGPHKKQVSGVVTDSKSKAPLPGVVVQCETGEGMRLNQDTTDSAGNFRCEIPKGLSEIRLVAMVAGYYPYDQKLPGESLKNDIALRHMPLEFGIPDNTPLDKGLEIVASTFNVTAVFSTTCTKRQKEAKIGSAEIQADSPDAAIKMLLDRVKVNGIRYRATPIEPGRRYEVACY